MEPVVLDKGARYRGVIVVDSPVGVPMSKVQSEFEGIGFADVQVWNDPRMLPEDWPPEDKEEPDVFLQQVFWAEGTWDGKDDQALITSGDAWSMAWIRQIDSPERFEQEVTGSKWGWLPLASATAANFLATWLWIRAGKE